MNIFGNMFKKRKTRYVPENKLIAIGIPVINKVLSSKKYNKIRDYIDMQAFCERMWSVYSFGKVNNFHSSVIYDMLMEVVNEEYNLMQK